MTFIELIIVKASNRIQAWQVYDHDRGDNHDWGLLSGQIFERIEGDFPKLEGNSEIHRFSWEPITRTIKPILDSKSNKNLQVEALIQEEKDQTEYLEVLELNKTLKARLKDIETRLGVIEENI